MSRVLLSASFILLSAALVMVAVANRYQYFSIVGPAWNGKTATETDPRRIDRWTGTPQVWTCEDVDTNRAASVPPPPAQPSDSGTSAGAVDAAAKNGAYLIALKGWHTRYPHVNPETMRVTKPHCNWDMAR
jgi:hypothetical protein